MPPTCVFMSMAHRWAILSGSPAPSFSSMAMTRTPSNKPAPTGSGSAYQDKSFTFEMKSPPASYFLKKALGLKSGSKEPGRAVAGKVTMAQCREIAEKKMQGMNARDLDAAAREIAGSARSMGLQVVE